MNVTIDDAMNAFTLLQESMNEEGFLYECLNMGIGALKTIKEGNFQINPCNVSRETLVKMAEYDCRGKSCSDCIYKIPKEKVGLECVSIKAKSVLYSQETLKEVAEWIEKNSMN